MQENIFRGRVQEGLYIPDVFSSPKLYTYFLSIIIIGLSSLLLLPYVR